MSAEKSFETVDQLASPTIRSKQLFVTSVDLSKIITRLQKNVVPQVVDLKSKKENKAPGIEESTSQQENDPKSDQWIHELNIPSTTKDRLLEQYQNGQLPDFLVELIKQSQRPNYQQNQMQEEFFSEDVPPVRIWSDSRHAFNEEKADVQLYPLLKNQIKYRELDRLEYLLVGADMRDISWFTKKLNAILEHEKQPPVIEISVLTLWNESVGQVIKAFDSFMKKGVSFNIEVYLYQIDITNQEHLKAWMQDRVERGLSGKFDGVTLNFGAALTYELLEEIQETFLQVVKELMGKNAWTQIDFAGLEDIYKTIISEVIEVNERTKESKVIRRITESNEKDDAIEFTKMILGDGWKNYSIDYKQGEGFVVFRRFVNKFEQKIKMWINRLVQEKKSKLKQEGQLERIQEGDFSEKVSLTEYYQNPGIVIEKLAKAFRLIENPRYIANKATREKFVESLEAAINSFISFIEGSGVEQHMLDNHLKISVMPAVEDFAFMWEITLSGISFSSKQIKKFDKFTFQEHGITHSRKRMTRQKQLDVFRFIHPIDSLFVESVPSGVEDVPFFAAA